MGKKLEKLPARQVTNATSKKEVIEMAQKDGKDSSMCSADGHVPPQELRVGARVPKKTKVGIVLRGDVVKDDSGSCAVFTEQGFVSITK